MEKLNNLKGYLWPVNIQHFSSFFCELGMRKLATLACFAVHFASVEEATRIFFVKERTFVPLITRINGIKLADFRPLLGISIMAELAVVALFEINRFERIESND